MIKVLDACALIAFLRDEKGADLVEAALIEGDCAAHALNACEVYKDCLTRGEPAAQADGLIDDLIATGLAIYEDMDEALWKNAARLKTRGKIAYADCFALELSMRLGGLLYSSDHHELDAFVGQEGLTIQFIR